MVVVAEPCLDPGNSSSRRVPLKKPWQQVQNTFQKWKGQRKAAMLGWERSYVQKLLDHLHRHLGQWSPTVSSIPQSPKKMMHAPQNLMSPTRARWRGACLWLWLVAGWLLGWWLVLVGMRGFAVSGVSVIGAQIDSLIGTHTGKILEFGSGELSQSLVQGWFLLQDAGLEAHERNLVMTLLKERVAQELKNKWPDHDLRAKTKHTVAPWNCLARTRSKTKVLSL